jgi:NDP-sugar pyrophosphorylase family protein
MKERVTLTIEETILQQVDNQVDGYNVKNRSHAVELLLLKALGSAAPKTGLILAGGKDGRLRPLSGKSPWPLVQLHNKPILQHSLDLFKRYGIRRAIITLGSKGEQIRSHFGDGRNQGMNISYLEEGEPLGTMNLLNLARPFLSDTFIICNADEVKNIDLAEMYRFHKENRAMATIALTTVDDPLKYGVVRLKGNRIVEFIEKPKSPQSNLINAGLYMMEPEVFEYLDQGTSIEKDIFPKIVEKGRLFGYTFDGQWFDVSTVERYEEAVHKWKDL